MPSSDVPPLLDPVYQEQEEDDEEEEEEEDETDVRRGRRWRCGMMTRKKKMTMLLKEAKQQTLFSLPMILTNIFIYAIPLASVMFAGHLGELYLAGSTLANSWATVTGFAFMTGLSGALETLCGQAFGAGLYKTLGIHLQASCIVSFLFSVLISIIWFFTKPILLLLHQDADIASTAALYMRFLIPGIFAYGFLQNMIRFMQTQTVVLPLIAFLGVPFVVHLGITYGLVYWTSLGYVGAPLAVSISLWLSFFALAWYICCARSLQNTRARLTSESFGYVLTNLRLGLPSAAMVCLEYWAFEILVLLAGLMEDAEETTSLIAMCVNTEAIAYMIIYGLSAAASTRVSNELGAGRPKRAKTATYVSMMLSILLAIVFVIALSFGHEAWAGLFSDSTSIIASFGYMTPFLAISITVDSIQGILSGVARGCGWQHLVVLVNLGTFYLIGFPVAILLGFKYKLHAKGLWIGLICGLCSQAIGLIFLTLLSKWTRSDLIAHA
ncbi:hypothetical protein MLD38_000493 [Melastoma candidum]|uniref:Uncharacterized protein n=1 Tax=Melastoma candidum TaxID=119954 RepID=A0ACB9SAB8_9MYRT|nr:hypothetical protein MLD38_000493 [Melastoma candidum]